MVTFGYLVFVFMAAMFGAVLGFIGHFARAHFTYTPEEVFSGGTLSDLANDLLSSNGTTFEKHVIGAEWDDNGFWDADSNRNLVYYVASGFIAPLFIGVLFWPDRAKLVGAACAGLLKIGLHSPLC